MRDPEDALYRSVEKAQARRWEFEDSDYEDEEPQNEEENLEEDEQINLTTDATTQET